MNDDPLLSLVVIGLAAYVFHLWYSDYKAQKAGNPNPKALPGALPVALIPVVIGVVGALALVGVETWGEYQLGVVDEQSTITWLFLLVMIAAGFIEEIVFRGYLIIRNKGRLICILAVIGFSALFALGHVQYYTDAVEDGAWYEFTFKLDAKSAWTLLLLFINSLWFYTLRFWPGNSQGSLIPCIAAHISSNIGVFVVKLLQGHVEGLY